MNPRLLGNPLLAWRDETTLQIGWGVHGLVVESAPRRLPQWLGLLTGTRSKSALLAEAEALGICADEAGTLLRRLQNVGLLNGGTRTLSVSIAGVGMVREPLAEALTYVGVCVRQQADVVVYPQGQLPSLAGAPAHERLIPVWFTGRAVHVGPVLDATVGPCPRCVDLAWSDHDGLWPQLVAQASSLGLWADRVQIVQAAAAIAGLGLSARTVGLELIIDEMSAGPCWRVWSVHPNCTCTGT